MLWAAQPVAQPELRYAQIDICLQFANMAVREARWLACWLKAVYRPCLAAGNGPPTANLTPPPTGSAMSKLCVKIIAIVLAVQNSSAIGPRRTGQEFDRDKPLESMARIQGNAG
jgi:hypothetical protein